MKKKLVVLALSMLGVAAALSVGAPEAEAATHCYTNCTTYDGVTCCDQCCGENGIYYCSGPLICDLG